MDSNLQKYLKYKKKYTDLKKELEGGGLLFKSQPSKLVKPSPVITSPAKSESDIDPKSPKSPKSPKRGLLNALSSTTKFIGKGLASGITSVGSVAYKGATIVGHSASNAASSVKNTGKSAYKTKQYDDAVDKYNKQPNTENWEKVQILKKECEKAASVAGYKGDNNCQNLPVAQEPAADHESPVAQEPSADQE